MRYRALLGVLAGIFLVATSAAAQDEAETPNPAFQVLTFELEPGTMIDWRAAVTRMANAARSHDLTASEVGWWLWHSGNRSVVVWPVPHDELFHGNDIFAKIGAADSTEAAAIGAMFEAAPGQQLSSEIVELVPDLSYEPATPLGGAPGGAEVVDVTVASGQGEAFNEGVKEYVAILGEVGYPYTMNTYRVRFGETRMQFVTFFDDQASFFGANDFNAMLQAKPALLERVQKAYRAWLKTVSHMERDIIYYDEEGSFPPQT